MKELVKFEAPELQAIEQSKAIKIKKTFQPMVKMLEGFESEVSEILKAAENGVDEPLTERAKRCRLDIAKIRIQADKVHKAEKEEYLRAGKAIDGVRNILKWAVTDREEKLREVENHFEILEEKRLEALQVERENELSKYVENADELDLAAMEDDVWEAYYNHKKQAHHDRIQAEKAAEKERLQREKQRNIEIKRSRELMPFSHVMRGDEKWRTMPVKEYNQLLADLREKKKAYDAEQMRVREENERLERERKEAEKKAEAERKKHEQQVRAEREKREALEKEKRERERAEQQRVEQAKKEAEKLAKQGVKKQLKAWIDCFEIPEFTGKKNPKAAEISARFEEFKNWAAKEVADM